VEPKLWVGMYPGRALSTGNSILYGPGGTGPSLGWFVISRQLGPPKVGLRLAAKQRLPLASARGYGAAGELTAS